MRNNKKYWTYGALLLVGYMCLLYLLPGAFIGTAFAAIAGWQIGGWFHTLAKIWSTENDNV